MGARRSLREMYSAAPISRYVSPRTRRSATSASRSDSGRPVLPSVGGRAAVPMLRAVCRSAVAHGCHRCAAPLRGQARPVERMAPHSGVGSPRCGCRSPTTAPRRGRPRPARPAATPGPRVRGRPRTGSSPRRRRVLGHADEAAGWSPRIAACTPNQCHADAHTGGSPRSARSRVTPSTRWPMRSASPSRTAASQSSPSGSRGRRGPPRPRRWSSARHATPRRVCRCHRAGGRRRRSSMRQQQVAVVDRGERTDDLRGVGEITTGHRDPRLQQTQADRRFVGRSRPARSTTPRAPRRSPLCTWISTATSARVLDGDPGVGTQRHRPEDGSDGGRGRGVERRDHPRRRAVRRRRCRWWAGRSVLRRRIPTRRRGHRRESVRPHRPPPATPRRSGPNHRNSCAAREYVPRRAATAAPIRTPRAMTASSVEARASSATRVATVRSSVSRAARASSGSTTRGRRRGAGSRPDPPSGGVRWRCGRRRRGARRARDD